MAVQTTPHTQSEENVNSAEMDLEPNMAPQDMGRGADAKIYENADGAQTGGNRSFHTTDGRDNQPKSLDEGTGLIPPKGPTLPQGDEQGVTNSLGSKERATQEKVLDK